MSTANIFDIYRKPQFDESIQKIETRTFHPQVKFFGNNDVTEISINHGDSWLLMHEAALYIEGQLEKSAGNGKISLVNNACAFLFDTISYELNGKEIESVRDPGIVSTIRGYLCYGSTDSKHLDIAGWTFPSSPIVNPTNGFFTFRIPLKHLFNVFNDYQLIQFGKQSIRLVRARNDQDCYQIEEIANPATKTVAKLTIKNIFLKVQIVFPNDILKIKLLESIKSDKPIIIPFRKWQYHELPQLTTGATKEVWAVRTSTAIESPRYVILAFQTNRRDAEEKDNTRFDNINLLDLRIMINGEYYPLESMHLDFENNNFVEAHHNYTQFYLSYKNDHIHTKQALLDYWSFKNHAVFVIDCSRRNETLKSSTVDVKVAIEAKKDFPANTKAYCIIIHDCIIEHLPLSEIVRNLS